MEHFPFYVRELVACLSVWYVGGNRKWMGGYVLELPINFDMIKLVSGKPPDVTPKNSKI